MHSSIPVCLTSSQAVRLQFPRLSQWSVSWLLLMLLSKPSVCFTGISSVPVALPFYLNDNCIMCWLTPRYGLRILCVQIRAIQLDAVWLPSFTDLFRVINHHPILTFYSSPSCGISFYLQYLTNQYTFVKYSAWAASFAGWYFSIIQYVSSSFLVEMLVFCSLATLLFCFLATLYQFHTVCCNPGFFLTLSFWTHFVQCNLHRFCKSLKKLLLY